MCVLGLLQIGPTPILPMHGWLQTLDTDLPE